VRLKLIPAGYPMGLPAMRELESRIAHLCGVLKTDTWRGRTVTERAAHVMTTVRDAERLHQAIRASSGGGSGETKDAAAGAGADVGSVTGAGAIPK
jgi:hypothetical protein